MKFEVDDSEKGFPVQKHNKREGSQNINKENINRRKSGKKRDLEQNYKMGRKKVQRDDERDKRLRVVIRF